MTKQQMLCFDQSSIATC